jgi:hypothetical protein
MATDEAERERLKAALFRDSTVQGDSALMEQYKLYLGMLDRISERRQLANSFFLSINTGVCALIGYMFSKDAAVELKGFFWMTPLAGILLSCFWYRLIKSYRDLNSAKFEVIHLIEERLPLSPYHTEWVALGEGKDSRRYTPFTHLEIWVPRCFIIMYSVMILMMVPWSKLRREAAAPKAPSTATSTANKERQDDCWGRWVRHACHDFNPPSRLHAHSRPSSASASSFA